MAAKWVLYSAHGSKPRGSTVSPADFGFASEESEDWKYLVDHRVVVKQGDPDAPAPPEEPETPEEPSPEAAGEEGRAARLEAEKEPATDKESPTE